MNDNDDKTIKINMPEIKLELSPEFGDVPSMWNMRMWLQKAIEVQGAKQIGAGMGMGEADIDFTLEGHDFNVKIKPIIKQ